MSNDTPLPNDTPPPNDTAPPNDTPPPNDTTMTVPQGRFTLTRPTGGRTALRAWDAADELLLQRVADLDVSPGATTVIVGDSHGALSIALAELAPTVVVDRHSSSRAIASNATANGVDPANLHVVDALTAPPERIDVALIRPARTLAMLEHQLRSLAPSLHSGSVVVSSSMVKHLHTSILEVFERVLGPTTTSLAHRRARLVNTVVSGDRPSDDEPSMPWDWPRFTQIEPGPLQLCWMPGVFSAGKLDRGTSLLLAHLPEIEPGDSVVDLGCGNGVLGLVAAIDQPDAAVTLVDDSSMAVAAARGTFDANGASSRVVWGDGLFDWAPDEDGDLGGSDGFGAAEGSADVVLCNPPFHDDHALVDAAAWKMFSESRRALRSGGEMWVVGNRHLGYHVKLRRLFGNVDVVSSDPKFVVLRSVCP